MQNGVERKLCIILRIFLEQTVIKGIDVVNGIS